MWKTVLLLDKFDERDGRPVRARTADLHRVKVNWNFLRRSTDS